MAKKNIVQQTVINFSSELTDLSKRDLDYLYGDGHWTLERIFVQLDFKLDMDMQIEQMFKSITSDITNQPVIILPGLNYAALIIGIKFKAKTGKFPRMMVFKKDVITGIYGLGSIIDLENIYNKTVKLLQNEHN